ncbi:hypothetical protein JCM3774_003718 [Rhodotorula dairenensis]
MARVKRSPSTSSPGPSSLSRDFDPTRRSPAVARPQGQRGAATIRRPAFYDKDELDCLPVVDAGHAQHAVKVPDKLHTPSASPNTRPPRQTPRTTARLPMNQDWLDVPGRRSSLQTRADREPVPESPSQRDRERRGPVSRSPATCGKLHARRPCPEGRRSASASPSRSPDRSAAERFQASTSPQKRTRRSSNGLTFKPPAPSALTEDRDLRAAQRARLQEQRLQALAKRRRVEQVDDENDSEPGEQDQVKHDRPYNGEASEEDEEEEQRRPSRPPANGRNKVDRRAQVATEEHPTRPDRGDRRRQYVGEASARRRPPKRIKPDPDELVEFVATSSAPPPPPPPPTAAAAGPSPPPLRAQEATVAPPLRRYPTPPTASAFLTTLPLPSLARLAPHFHQLGCTSPGELLVLCDPAQRPLRDEFLREVADKAGGVSALERMMLNREMDCGWQRWTGADDDNPSGGRQQPDEGRRAQGGTTSAVLVAA